MSKILNVFILTYSMIDTIKYDYMLQLYKKYNISKIVTDTVFARYSSFVLMTFLHIRGSTRQ